MVEVKDPLPEVKILEQGWAALSDAQGVLVITDWHTLLRGEHRNIVTGDLGGFRRLAREGFQYCPAGPGQDRLWTGLPCFCSLGCGGRINTTGAVHPCSP
jgi:hypothetical protein